MGVRIKPDFAVNNEVQELVLSNINDSKIGSVQHAV
jgi:hypothetical protein